MLAKERRNDVMLGAFVLTKSHRRHKWKLAGAIICTCLVAPLDHAVPEDDRFQVAVNYIFTGKTDPSDKPEIIDRKSCVVMLPESQNKRYVKYYLGQNQ